MHQNESWGKGGRVAFEELISLSHLDVSSVSDSPWKPQFHTFLTVPLMITDNVQRLPGNEASNNECKVSGDRLRWSWLSFIIWPFSGKSNALGIPETKHLGPSLCALFSSYCPGYLVFWERLLTCWVHTVLFACRKLCSIISTLQSVSFQIMLDFHFSRFPTCHVSLALYYCSRRK